MDDPDSVASVATYIPTLASTTLTGLRQSLIPADPSRLVLILTCTVNAGATVLWIGQVGVGGLPVNVVPNTVYEFTWQKHGPLCQFEVIAPAGSPLSTVGWYLLSSR